MYWRKLSGGILIVVVVLALLVLLPGANTVAESTLTPMEQLGKELFFDVSLSANGTQSCAACHAPDAGFAGPVSEINAAGAVYPGALPNHFGNRRPPSAAYAGDSPILSYDPEEGVWVGGMFWDGRASGWTLSDPLAEQAQGPFLNPLEQALPNQRAFCQQLKLASYADLFEEVWGMGSLDCVKGLELTYERVARSIAAYERSAEVNPYSSRFDEWVRAGEPEDGGGILTPEELQGKVLFEGKAMCSACHISEVGPDGELPLFTDFTYDNLGVPKNPENPFYDMPPNYNPDGEDWIDYGLGVFLKNAGYPAEVYEPEMGKHKVPTLRNVDLRPEGDEEFVRAYMHNGVFKSLEEVVHFYNTRDTEPWAPPEVGENINTDELGNLNLTAEEEAALVAFMKALSDQ